MRNHLSRRRLLLASIAACALAAPAWAAGAEPKLAGPQAELLKLAKANRMEHYVRDVGGVPRLYVHAKTGAQVNAMRQHLGPGTDRLALCHFDVGAAGKRLTPGLGGAGMHTEAVWEGKNRHFQNVGGKWQWGPWFPNEPANAGNNVLRESNAYKICGNLIQLPKASGDKFRGAIAKAKQNQAQGRGMGNAFPAGNCASVWPALPIAPKGQTLGQWLGIGNTGDPHGLQRSVENCKSPAVYGVVVFGPVDNFAADKGQQFQNGR